MSSSINVQLIFAILIVVFAVGVFGWLVWSKIKALGLLREDFDRRAPWLALGVLIGGAMLYYVKN